MSDFLQLSGKTFLVQGVANKKSVAWFMRDHWKSRALASLRGSLRSTQEDLEAQLAGKPVFICDAEEEGACASPRKCPPPVSPRCTAWSTDCVRELQ